LLVPPGDYGIHISGGLCYTVTRYVHIEPGVRELKLHVDLPLRRLPAELVGHPAPELRDIKAWKNGGPVTLAGLRGKVVLLDFWGYWCGPCMASMPELMKLHDRFKDKGLVIIAVHDDSIASIAEMDQKVETARKGIWGGRDLPFLVALDGGGRTRIPGTGIFIRGATDAAYNVSFYPTTLLIGKDGTVLREFEIDDPPAEVEKVIESALTAPAAR
jgi:thiol-disulfide isomerase/thioredoxin